MKPLNKFWYDQPTEQYIVSKKQPTNKSFEISALDYFAAKHPNIYVYDIEVYKNVFTVTVIRVFDGGLWRFEISERKHEGVDFFIFLTEVKNSNGRMVGYNNVHYDYPVIHELIKLGGHIDNDKLHSKSQSIIKSNSPFPSVWESDWYVEQIDLLKIHHFDNNSRRVSLKMLEYNMRSESIEDLPFHPHLPLSLGQIDTLIDYNDFDVFRTADFLYETIHMIEYRDGLTKEYGKNFTNHNDTKIGKDFLIMQLEKSGIPCHHRPNGKKEPIQTVREIIDLDHAVIPSMNFSHPEFKRVLDYFKKSKVKETKGVLTGLNCTVDGFKYVFGTGGIHGSCDPMIAYSDADFEIVDIDVRSYYPKLAIENGFFPEHLTGRFCQVYNELFEMRPTDKSNPLNKTIKLALNGSYGDSNNKFSPFYDPLFTMRITINGQLLLCVLSEWLRCVPDIKMLQVNTDGVTVLIPRKFRELLNMVCKSWEEYTGLELEYANYNRMFIRDVNNYIAEYEDGTFKRKGAYDFDDLDWHKDFSAQVVKKAAFANLTRDEDVETFIKNHDDDYDFTLCIKVPRTSRLELHRPNDEKTIIQNTTRYFITNRTHQKMVKVMPPTYKQLEKNPDAPERKIGQNVGWQVSICNDMRDFDRDAVNYNFYISEAKKLIDPLRGK